MPFTALSKVVMFERVFWPHCQAVVVALIMFYKLLLFRLKCGRWCMQTQRMSPNRGSSGQTSLCLYKHVSHQVYLDGACTVQVDMFAVQQSGCQCFCSLSLELVNWGPCRRRKKKKDFTCFVYVYSYHCHSVDEHECTKNNLIRCLSV